MLWAHLSAIAILYGLAFAPQLEARRAGVTEPRDGEDADGESVAMDADNSSKSDGRVEDLAESELKKLVVK